MARCFRPAAPVPSKNSAHPKICCKIARPQDPAFKLVSEQSLKLMKCLSLREKCHLGCESGANLMRCFSSKEKSVPRDAKMGQSKVFLDMEATQLPDHILEMCLARLPLLDLLRARAVCKKWRQITLSPHFLKLRRRFSSPKPWLFLFGISQDNAKGAQIRALDPTQDQWHTIRAEILRDRMLYSVAAVGSSIYVVGGCINPASNGSSNSKAQRGVLVFDVLAGTWKRAASMGCPRSLSAIAVFEIKDRKAVFRAGDLDYLLEEERALHKRGRQKGSGSVYAIDEDFEAGLEEQNRGSFGILVAGGKGKYNEHLDSVEIYDPVSDRWKGMGSWPMHFGNLSSGTVCGRNFFAYFDSGKLASLDLETGTWRSVNVMNNPSQVHCFVPRIVVCAGKILLISVSWSLGGTEIGHNQQQTAVRKIFELVGSENFGWTEVGLHPDAPLDWNAVFLGHGQRLYGVELFKIFGKVMEFVTVCEMGNKSAKWGRVSGPRMAGGVDANSCITKTAVVLEL